MTGGRPREHQPPAPGHRRADPVRQGRQAPRPRAPCLGRHARQCGDAEEGPGRWRVARRQVSFANDAPGLGTCQQRARQAAMRWADRAPEYWLPRHRRQRHGWTREVSPTPTELDVFAPDEEHPVVDPHATSEGCCDSRTELQAAVGYGLVNQCPALIRLLPALVVAIHNAH